MAEIDKGLPNTRSKLEIPSEEAIQEEQVAVQEAEAEQGPIEVIPEDDGGVTLDFEPGAINVPGTESHFDNLVYQHLEEGNLELAIDLVKRLETNPFDKKVISLYLKDGENQQTELKVNETIELLNSMK